MATKRYAYHRKCKQCGKDFSTNKDSKVFCEYWCQTAYNLENANRRNSGTAYHKIRWEILVRDNFTCQYCGRTPTEHGVVLQVDHIRPKIRGGTDEKINLITSCEDCNIGKRDYYNEAFGKRFKNRKKNLDNISHL